MPRKEKCQDDCVCDVEMPTGAKMASVPKTFEGSAGAPRQLYKSHGSLPARLVDQLIWSEG